MRKSLDETWRCLEAAGEDPPRRTDGTPAVPDSIPSYDDELGFGYRLFRTRLADVDFGHLNLPRTYFGRSWIIGVSFANTDLTESRMCWNDFDECDFSGADLSRCDMRSSIFRDCKFVGAVFRGTDLRRSSFQRCDFTGADLDGAVAATDAVAGDGSGRVQEVLAPEQRAVMTWTEQGPEPPGG